MKPKFLFFYSLFILTIFSCNNDNSDKQLVFRNNTISKEVALILDNIKKVEYSSIKEFRKEAIKLKQVNDTTGHFLFKYYWLKADFLEYYDFMRLKNYNSIYNELKKRKMYKLMAEVDILSTFHHYEHNLFEKSITNIERSLEYCFNTNMFLERQALIYGISPMTIVNSPKELKEELLDIIKEIEKFDWSFYHSRIYHNLALAYFYLKEYEASKVILDKIIKNNTKHNIHYDLGSNYRLYARISQDISKDYKEYIKYYNKSTEYIKKYGNKYLLINYRMIGHKYFSNKRFSEAYKYYKLAVNDESSSECSLAVDLAYLGYAYFKMDKKKNAEKAIAYYDKALTYSKKGGTGYRIASERKNWTLNAIGKKKEAMKIKLALAESAKITYETAEKNKYQEFKLNTILKLKTKNYRLANLEKENKLQYEKINNQKLVNIIFLLVFAMSLFLFYLLYLNGRNLKKIRGLNQKLQVALNKVKMTNLDLSNKNAQISNLLALNERTLFTKQLEISTNKDALRKIGTELSNIIASNVKISTNKLFSIENSLKAMFSEKEIWNEFKIQFENIRPNFFEKLKKTGANLSVNELKHCSYIVVNLKSKEVASLINVSPRSVETARYRIKKKLKLSKNQTLYNFLQKL